jgi:hypothetical protein|eukprot:COSAG01_NODE_6388_length_3698_cov_77.775493_2_plen_83_part_00
MGTDGFPTVFNTVRTGCGHSATESLLREPPQATGTYQRLCCVSGTHAARIARMSSDRGMPKHTAKQCWIIKPTGCIFVRSES